MDEMLCSQGRSKAFSANELGSVTTASACLSSALSPQRASSGDCPYLVKHSIYDGSVGDAVGEGATVGVLDGAGATDEVGDGESVGSGVEVDWRMAAGEQAGTAMARIAARAAPNRPCLNLRDI